MLLPSNSQFRGFTLGLDAHLAFLFLDEVAELLEVAFVLVPLFDDALTFLIHLSDDGFLAVQLVFQTDLSLLLRLQDHARHVPCVPNLVHHRPIFMTKQIHPVIDLLI